jgi:hypothetical protein
MGETPRPTSPWRGYINQLTYAVNFQDRVSQEIVERIADAILEQRVFGDPAEAYYNAATAALASGDRVAGQDDKDEIVRDFLQRLLLALEERKPWPEPPFRALDNGEWAAFQDAPTVGRIPLSRMSVTDRLSKLFSPAPGAGSISPADILILRLRSGERVALVAPQSFTEQGVAVQTYADPDATLAAFKELTGLDVVPSTDPPR